jgi:hypothetical protein
MSPLGAFLHPTIGLVRSGQDRCVKGFSVAFTRVVASVIRS